MDEGIALKNISWVVSLLLGQVTLNIGSLISSATNNYLLYQTGLNIGMDISRQYVEKLVKLPLQLFDTKLGTDFLQRLNDEERIRTFLMYIANSFIFIILNVFVYSCILLYYNTYVFLIFIFFGCLGILITRWILHIRKQIDYTLFVSLGKKRNIENELVYGMTEIKINKAHLSFVHQWKELQTDINKLLLRSSLYGTGISNGVSFFNIIRDTLITGGCAWLVIENKMSIGIMMTITYLLGQLSSSVNQITQFSHTAQDAILAYKRMEDILKIPDENEGKQPYSQLSSKNGFFLKNVSFKYDGSFNPYVLKNINAEIPIGKVTAIVGASGSGKTTLLKLLLAFYYPQQGNIKVMGKDMKELNVDLWRDKCGAVMQEGYIFSGSIADNIALSSLSKQIDMERIKHAAQIACLDSFIEHLPMKYYTKIGKSGMELSGGQKQRILIARAVYKNPEFIFFDEATSSLDASNEKEIMEHLKIFYQNRTVIIIAHRLSTVRDADNIIVLENGSLIEQGSHQELIKKEGAYYKLIKNQLELGQ